MTNLFKHRYDTEQENNKLNMVDTVHHVADNAMAILNMLIGYFASDSDRMPDYEIAHILTDVHHNLSDINAIVNHYYMATTSGCDGKMDNRKQSADDDLSSLSAFNSLSK